MERSVSFEPRAGRVSPRRDNLTRRWSRGRPFSHLYKVSLSSQHATRMCARLEIRTGVTGAGAAKQPLRQQKIKNAARDGPFVKPVRRARGTKLIVNGQLMPSQASMTRMSARLEIRIGRLAVASREGARSASEMQSCWLDKLMPCSLYIIHVM